MFGKVMKWPHHIFFFYNRIKLQVIKVRFDFSSNLKSYLILEDDYFKFKREA